MQQEFYKDDEVDLFELFEKILNYKKEIFVITICITFLALLYTILATPWYQASALVKTGYYKSSENEEILIENTADIVQQLSVKYIELLKNTKDIEYKVKKITEVKNNKKFFNIEVVAVSKEVAAAQINKIVQDIASQHKNTLDAFLENKRVQLANIERQISFLKNNKILEKTGQIEYVKSVQIPRLDRQIAYMQEAIIPAARRDLSVIDNVTLPALEKSLKLSMDRLAKYEYDLAKFMESQKINTVEDAMLRQIAEQGLYAQISNLEQSIIELEKQKEIIATQTKPDIQNRLDRLISVDFENMLSDKDVIINERLPSLQRELQTLQTEELSKLLDQKSLVELSLRPYNYKNTAIVSEIIISEKPIGPKKEIIILVAFCGGLMLSIFAVLVHDSIKNRSRHK
ncbi:Wzz/FepE/Etk N-terminal domain-containing protein [Campylobacter sp. CCUG 57310]|uniref:Wzz/FepE/Etk N-terminal domain-containing protein n=1 Tax=Campylobacter sp. CCUG 57310 TaxID=2517362 RepID=UPI00156323F8|nr:Wzz/FepE/Etk N-terminal domain-containing protein [Campylobacter sp. CCUG 57310]QKF91999.1 putative chain length determinant protein, Wzz family [Campylobacter sp. CCUG 57310]